MVCITDTVSYETCYRNEKITVTLEYPEQTDQKAEQEFYGRLKEWILWKTDTESAQNGKQSGSADEIQNGISEGET